MPLIQLTTTINAPIEICFNLSRDIGVHQLSVAGTKEKAIAGRTSGLCASGDTVTWEAIHFGIKQKMTVRVSAVNFPTYFEDQMISGAFKSMHHKHIYRTEKGTTIMKDEFKYATPFGIFGKLADYIFLEKYMRNFLLARNAYIKAVAEEQAAGKKQ